MAGYQVKAFSCQINTVVFLVYCEKQFRIHLRHITLLLAQVVVFCLLQYLLVALLTQILNQGGVLRQAPVCTIQVQSPVFFIRFTLCYKFLRFCQALGYNPALFLNQLFNTWFQLSKLLLFAARSRT